jgi:hypothetical protein
LLGTNFDSLGYYSLLLLAVHVLFTYQPDPHTDFNAISWLTLELILMKNCTSNKYYITWASCHYKLCRTWEEVTLNHVNPNAGGIGQGEARHRKYKRLKLGSSQAYDFS